MTAVAIETLSLTQLASLYNEATGSDLKKFADKKSGIARLQKALDEKGLALGTLNGAPVLVTPESPEELDRVRGEEEFQAIEDAEKAPVVDKPKRTRSKKADATKSQRAEYGEDQVITVVEAPEAREGSLRAARVAALRTGMTVGEYLDAAHEANDKRRSRHKYHSDIRRFVKSGSITIG